MGYSFDQKFGSSKKEYNPTDWNTSRCSYVSWNTLGEIAMGKLSDVDPDVTGQEKTQDLSLSVLSGLPV